MINVYVVMREEGSYSDTAVWPMAVYSDRAKADNHATKAIVRHVEIKAEVMKQSHRLSNFDDSNKWDPCRFNQITRYYVEEVELDPPPPEVDGD